MSELLRLAEELEKSRQRESDLHFKMLHLRSAIQLTEHTIDQTLGAALGYPLYTDDPEQFPDAKPEDGVCTGDHTAVSLADEAAKEIVSLKERVEYLEQENKKLKYTLDGDPDGTASIQDRFSWRQSAIRYAQRIEAEISVALNRIETLEEMGVWQPIEERTRYPLSRSVLGRRMLFVERRGSQYAFIQEGDEGVLLEGDDRVIERVGASPKLEFVLELPENTAICLRRERASSLKA